MGMSPWSQQIFSFPISVCMLLLGFSKDNEMKNSPSVTAHPLPCAGKSFRIIQCLGFLPPSPAREESLCLVHLGHPGAGEPVRLA